MNYKIKIWFLVSLSQIMSKTRSSRQRINLYKGYGRVRLCYHYHCSLTNHAAPMCFFKSLLALLLIWFVNAILTTTTSTQSFPYCSSLANCQLYLILHLSIFSPTSKFSNSLTLKNGPRVKRFLRNDKNRKNYLFFFISTVDFSHTVSIKI